MKSAGKNLSPFLIAALLGCFTLFLGWAAHRAATHGSEVSDPDYYQKGFRYNATLLEKHAASSLGWQIEPRLEGRTLAVELLDGRDQPVSGAEAIIQLTRKAATAPQTLSLRESSPGVYELKLPRNLQGETQARIAFHKDGARLDRQLLLNL